MLSDPQSITYASADKSLPAISRGTDSSVYAFNDSGVDYTLTVSHAFAKRNRAIVRLTRSSYASDVLVPANSVLASMSVTLTMDWPVTGLSVADITNAANALVAYLGTSGLVGRIAGGET